MKENYKIINNKELSEEQIKQEFITKGILIEKSNMKDYDKKIFQNVSLSMKLVKLFLFLSLFFYALINIFGVVLSITYHKFSLATFLGQTVGCLAVLLLCFVIFRNINTNRSIERETLYVSQDNFLFNYTNGVVPTPNLFYCLSYEYLHKIEFEVYGKRKNQVFGRVIFTFQVLDCQIKHYINFVNLTEVKHYITSRWSTLLTKLVVDGKSERTEDTPRNKKRSASLYSIGCLLFSALFFVLFLMCNIYNLSLVIAGAVLLFSAILIFISCFLYFYHLIQGIILSSIFMIIGFCIPLFIFFETELPLLEFIASNNLLLLIMFFGNIGLVLYGYCIAFYVNKISYLIRNKTIF